MSFLRRNGLSRLLLTLQLTLVIGGATLLALWPPTSGRMLLVPMTDAARPHLIAAAIEQGARLVVQGPLTGSMIVSGERDRLLTTLARRGIATIAAPAGGCGSTQGTA